MDLITTVIILLAVTLFLVGIVIGWVFSPGGTTRTQRGKIRTVIALSVTIVWIATTLADIILTGYTVSPLLHGLMGAVVGYFFTEDGLNLTIGTGD